MAKLQGMVIDINRKDNVLVVSSYMDDQTETMEIEQTIEDKIDAELNDQVVLLSAIGSVLNNLEYVGPVTLIVPQVVALRGFQILKAIKEKKSRDDCFGSCYLSWMDTLEGMSDAVQEAIEGIYGAVDRGIQLRIVSALSLYSHRLQCDDDSVLTSLRGKKIRFENSVAVETEDGKPVEGIAVRDQSYITGVYAITVREIQSKEGKIRYEGTIPRYYNVRTAEGSVTRMTGFEASADLSIEGNGDNNAHSINMIRLHVQGASQLPRKVTKKKIVVNSKEA